MLNFAYNPAGRAPESVISQHEIHFTIIESTNTSVLPKVHQLQSASVMLFSYMDKIMFYLLTFSK